MPRVGSLIHIACTSELDGEEHQSFAIYRNGVWTDWLTRIETIGRLEQLGVSDPASHIDQATRCGSADIDEPGAEV